MLDRPKYFQPARVDHTGEIFEHCVITGRSKNKTKDNEYFWIVQCECGNTYEVRYTHLKHGQNATCGDYENHKKEIQIKVGNTYGGFKVIKEVDRLKLGAKRNYRQFSCSCIYCGTNKVITYNILMSCPPPDCGCRRLISKDDLNKMCIRLNIDIEDNNIFSTQTVIWKCSIHGSTFENTYFTLKKFKYSPCPECTYERRKHRFLGVAEQAKLIWLGPVVTSGKKTTWQCYKGHTWEATIGDIRKGNRCSLCSGRFFFNGVLISKMQLELAKLLGVEDKYINYKISRYAIDIALINDKIAVEYDGIVWHEDSEKEHKRDEYLLSRGWKTIRFKSERGDILPSVRELEEAFNRIITEDVVVIYLEQ